MTTLTDDMIEEAVGLTGFTLTPNVTYAPDTKHACLIGICALAKGMTMPTFHRAIEFIGLETLYASGVANGFDGCGVQDATMHVRCLININRESLTEESTRSFWQGYHFGKKWRSKISHTPVLMP